MITMKLDMVRGGTLERREFIGFNGQHALRRGDKLRATDKIQQSCTLESTNSQRKKYVCVFAEAK